MIHIRHYHIRIYIALLFGFLFTGFYEADHLVFYPLFGIPISTWAVVLFIVIFYNRLRYEYIEIKTKLVHFDEEKKEQQKGEEKVGIIIDRVFLFTIFFVTHIVVYAYFNQHTESFGPYYPLFCLVTGMYAAFFTYIYSRHREMTEEG